MQDYGYKDSLDRFISKMCNSLKENLNMFDHYIISITSEDDNESQLNVLNN